MCTRASSFERHHYSIWNGNRRKWVCMYQSIHFKFLLRKPIITQHVLPISEECAILDRIQNNFALLPNLSLCLQLPKRLLKQHSRFFPHYFADLFVLLHFLLDGSDPRDQSDSYDLPHLRPVIPLPSRRRHPFHNKGLRDNFLPLFHVGYSKI